MTGSPTVAFSAAEITDAYSAFHEKVAVFAASGEWEGYADLFTPDAVYVEHAMGTFTGREEIRAWSVRTMTSYPGRVMTGFPISWQVVDAEQARLVCEVLNPMPDPGDGTMLTEPNITIMTYAGDGLFSREEDVYNPLRFHALALKWAKIAAAHGNADEDVLVWLDKFGGGR
ncbi:polyketide cyclase [Nocardioides sp. Root190]|uniref:nuclear transport factor 2 family protein n=1 Tax=Nocardioides sp. Root190 TaxID=1736488 RepID=UPI0006FF0665|nr:nuclear transport factor 2 family protein [Nocardioides sp. Root190]KRB78451.1 polyketide cyclase [Nocardioides sp. Root190]